MGIANSRTATNAALAISLLLATSFAVLLPVVPVIMESRGHPGDAGAATAALLAATVVGEVIAPVLLRRFSTRSLVFAALLVAGLSSLFYPIPDLGLIPILAITCVRGAGFGVTGVVCMILVSKLARPGRRGAAIGLYGIATTAPLVLFPSVGLYLLGAGHLEAAVLLSAVTAALGAIIGIQLSVPDTEVVPAEARLKKDFLHGSAVRLLLSLSVVMMSFGGVISFVPLILPTQGLGSSVTFLFVAGVTRTFSRWLSGELADRYKPIGVVLVGISAATVGLAILPLSSAPNVVVVAAAIYGVGFGAVQTGTYLSIVQSTRADAMPVTTAAWNVAIDSGIAVGAAILGVIAAKYGYSAVLWFMPVIVISAIPLALGGIREQPRATG